MIQHEGKYVFYMDPNDCCGDLECGTCGGRMWIGDWEIFKEKGADLDDYLKEGDEIYLYWDHTPEGKIWHKEEHIKPDRLMHAIALKEHNDDEDEWGGWYAEFGSKDDSDIPESDPVAPSDDHK